MVAAVPASHIADLIGHRLEVLTATTATREFEAIRRHGSSGASTFSVKRIRAS